MWLKLLIFCVLITSFCGCNNKDQVHYANSYVLEYRSINEFNIVKVADRGLALSYPNYGYQVLGRFIDQGEKRRKFDELCQKHNDVGYAREITLLGIAACQIIDYIYLGDDFTSIDIVSDADFDDDHQAGSSLNDLVRYLGISPKKFIDSGYASTYNWKKKTALSDEFKQYYLRSSSFDGTWYPIDKLVSELTPDDLLLLGTGKSHYYFTGKLGYLHFEASPTLKKDHRITVTLTTDDGRELSDSVDITFE